MDSVTRTDESTKRDHGRHEALVKSSTGSRIRHLGEAVQEFVHDESHGNDSLTAKPVSAALTLNSRGELTRIRTADRRWH